jgi:large subunit ribosomal protein L31
VWYNFSVKKAIQPKYYYQVEVLCACGNKMITGSVLPGPMRVEICSKCHPFYTGEKRLVDTEGRVERFERQVQKAEVLHAEDQTRKKNKKVEKPTDNQQTKTLSLKDLLQQARGSA